MISKKSNYPWKSFILDPILQRAPLSTNFCSKLWKSAAALWHGAAIDVFKCSVVLFVPTTEKSHRVMNDPPLHSYSKHRGGRAMSLTGRWCCECMKTSSSEWVQRPLTQAVKPDSCGVKCDIFILNENVKGVHVSFLSFYFHCYLRWRWRSKHKVVPENTTTLEKTRQHFRLQQG